MNKSHIAISVVVAAVVLISAVSVLQNREDPSEDTGDRFEFTDAKGYKHSIETPITNVSVVHKYIPMFMKILGKESEVAGLDSTYGITFQKFFENSFSIGGFSEPDGPTMLKHGSKIILTPITMGLTNYDSLTEMGITVIYIDLTDSYVIEDNLKLLVKLLGDTEELNERYDTYMGFFDDCEDYVSQFDFSELEDVNFALYMASSGFYHTHHSAAAKVIESLAGKSYERIIDPNYKETVYFDQSPEVIVGFDGKHTLDYLFIYTMDTPEENYQTFLNRGGNLDYSQLTAVKEGHAYALSTECVNGALSCVSKILYAEAFGMDTGTKAVEFITLFNETFGLDYSTENLIVQVGLSS